VLLVDYNSWIESPQGLKLAASLDKNVVLAEGTSFCYPQPRPFTILLT